MNQLSKLCLTHFNPKKVIRRICCDCNSTVGKSHASLRFIDKGSVTFNLSGRTLSACEGDLLFIPEGACYYAVWKGEPEVVFYSIDFNLAKSGGSSYDNRFSLCKIEGGQVEAVKKVIFDAYTLCGENCSDSDKMTAMSLFYGAFSSILPLLEPSREDEIPKSVKLALDYIGKNYKSDFTGKDVARACFISESRLYHLFSEVMKCSPVTYKNRLKINDAINMLTQTELSVEEIAAALSFNSAAYFRKVFKSMTGANPHEYRRSDDEIKNPQ